MAVQANPAIAAPHFLLAGSLQRNGQPELARRALQEALARGPCSPELMLSILPSNEPRVVEGRARMISTIDGMLRP